MKIHVLWAWTLRRWASGSRRFEGSKCLDLQFKQSSRTSHYRYAHSQLMVAGNILCLYVYKSISSYQLSRCRRHVFKSARVFFQRISDAMRLPPRLYAFVMFLNMLDLKRTALDCSTSVQCENQNQTPGRDRPLSWAWPYLERSMIVPWAKRDHTHRVKKFWAQLLTSQNTI
jgi:hypothetical protein